MVEAFCGLDFVVCSGLATIRSFRLRDSVFVWYSTWRCFLWTFIVFSAGSGFWIEVLGVQGITELVGFQVYRWRAG